MKRATVDTFLQIYVILYLKLRIYFLQHFKNFYHPVTYWAYTFHYCITHFTRSRSYFIIIRGERKSKDSKIMHHAQDFETSSSTARDSSSKVCSIKSQGISPLRKHFFLCIMQMHVIFCNCTT